MINQVSRLEKVAAARLREIKQLKRMLEEDRANLALRVRQDIERLMHAGCLASYVSPPWKLLLDKVEEGIRDDVK